VFTVRYELGFYIQKTAFSIVTAVKTSSLTKLCLVYDSDSGNNACHNLLGCDGPNSCTIFSTFRKNILALCSVSKSKRSK
jgi:hypothetical protein